MAAFPHRQGLDALCLGSLGSTTWRIDSLSLMLPRPGSLGSTTFWLGRPELHNLDWQPALEVALTRQSGLDDLAVSQSEFDAA